MLAALFAAYLAAAPLDAPHAALLDVLTRENDSMAACGAAKLQKISASATVKKLGRAGADEVVLAEVFDPCICGAQNCPLYVLRLSPGKPRVLLTAFSIGVKLKPAAQLPTLIVRSHDSAAISGEETYTYRNGEYALTGSARVRGDNERKTVQEVRFAPGASSANLRGSVSTGWYDEYVFAATKGQKLLVDGV
ncbi:MAG TPA: hypothetical protein VGX96_08245, partial [Candidatus Elarobacter sp.]|nr:hypothetical protein [Candidatus Elarobacter sp.]